MVLVDEKLLEYQPMLQHFQTKQDLSWKRPTEQVVKSGISHQMKSTLDDPTIPEDVKVKAYGQNLNRFLRAKRKLVEQEVTKEKKTAHPTIPEDVKVKPAEPEVSKEPETKVKTSKKPKKKKKTSPIVATRISLRSKQIPKPFMWDEWS